MLLPHARRLLEAARSSNTSSSSNVNMTSSNANVGYEESNLNLNNGSIFFNGTGMVDLGESEFGYSDMQTVFLACIATLIPLVFTLLAAIGVRYMWHRFRARKGEGYEGVLQRDESSDPLAVKSLSASGNLLTDEMTGYHQPKDLFVVALDSFTAYMLSVASELIKKLDDEKITHKSIETCRKLQDIYHNSRLPPVIANVLTNHLLKRFDTIFPSFQKWFLEKWCQEILMNLTELFMHPSVTVIELGPTYLHAFDSVRCNFIMPAILKKVHKLHNLKILHLQVRSHYYCGPDGHFFFTLPPQLKEFTVFHSLNDEDLNMVAESCKELTSLAMLDWEISEFSTPHITKCKYLEVLHIRGGYKIDKGCVGLLNAISPETPSDKLSSSTIRSFGMMVKEESTFRLIVDKLPNLTKIVLICSRDIDLSSLTQLKKLRSLSLEVSYSYSEQYKKILPDLGNQLVSLDLRRHFYLDLEFIGKTCSQLKCLHVEARNKGFYKPSSEILQNFRTVECLQVKMLDYDWAESLIVHCLNIKKLDVTINYRGYDVLENVLKRTSLDQLEEIHWLPEIEIPNDFTEELCVNCPNLRIVHGLSSNNFTHGRVSFDLLGCEINFCKSYVPLPEVRRGMMCGKPMRLARKLKTRNTHYTSDHS